MTCSGCLCILWIHEKKKNPTKKLKYELKKKSSKLRENNRKYELNKAWCSSKKQIPPVRNQENDSIQIKFDQTNTKGEGYREIKIKKI